MCKLIRFPFRLRIFFAKNNWQVSKKGNLYNPSLGGTVYRCDDKWNFAKDDFHHSGYHSKKDAQNSLLWLWIYEKKNAKPRYFNRVINRSF
jgi:hypothetical protein